SIKISKILVSTLSEGVSVRTLFRLRYSRSVRSACDRSDSRKSRACDTLRKRRRTCMRKLQTVFATTMLSLLGSHVSPAQSAMTCCITSKGPGDGANLGGLAGADKHCQALAKAAGAGNRTWHAYLSASASGGQAAVNAKDRIGKGPWTNAKGVK